ncbi:hypothetical protein TKK_0014973 [Trichogramma kaykai]|uniref:Delta-like protein n=1 Tax=Trichogramma kaykai TaxID=54128 RepID=A0ABD2WCA5_9HYME
MTSIRSRTSTIALGLFLALLGLTTQLCSASGVFELRLKRFDNLNGKDSLGKCCAGQPLPGSDECSGRCRVRFRICLKQYQVNIDTSTPCTYGDVVTPVLDDPAKLKLNTSDFTNPISFPFDFTWPGTFSLIVEAFHDSLDNVSSKGGHHAVASSNNNNTNSSYHSSSIGSSSNNRVIITRLATQRWLDVGSEWVEDEHKSHSSEMLYDYRVTCSPYYYGKGCENLCRPRDDSFGHYRCSSAGQRVCLSGWKGDYCATPQCLAGCDEQHGYCSRPNECLCHNGWTGPFCDQCVRYPGCSHGSCQKPWECLCDEGWGGLFCNQDLNYCTNHKPCHNGGTCFNTGQGSYTCACAPGFTGTDCETPLLDCSSQPCLNQGTCLPSPANGTQVEAIDATGSSSTSSSSLSIARKYRCSCPQGWRGRHCEVSSRSCRDSPCARGATCEDDSERGFKCHCPAGYEGPDCERQIDECAPSPCANGGTCTDLLAGFRCTCPAGFSGERCQINNDDCADMPCLNGATCIDLVNRYRCQCVPGYVGRLCQEKVDYCLHKPCANGGNCTSAVNDYQCLCKPGFTGKDCSVDVDECLSAPCLHGGSCRDRVNGYSCDCAPGWRGDNCAEPITASAIRPNQPGYWTAGGRSAAAVAAAPESQEGVLSTEHVVVIATISTAVPAFVFIAVVAVMCMKRRQKREQAKADEEARLQNERNAVHSSMSKRATAMLSGPLDPNGGGGDPHMIKNTWNAQSSCSQLSSSDRSSTSGKSVNNDIYDASLLDSAGAIYNKAEPVQDLACRQVRSTKQLNTEAAAHRASQHLYSQKSIEKDSCQQQLLDKRASTLFSATDSCCASVCGGDLKRPNTNIVDSLMNDTQQQQHSDGGCSAVYVIDEHYARRDPLATDV